jgi:cytidylate kinase
MRKVAERLCYRHVDSGAMYRAVAWYALRHGLALHDGAVVARAASGLVFDVGAGYIRVDGEDVSGAIRTPEIDGAAAQVARLPAVRAVLVARQQALGAAGGVVMEGRDIGTVVFPGADVKIYLDASREERARRRAADPAHARPGPSTLSEVARELDARDESDRTRAASPLAVAPDAHVLDTTGVAIEDVVGRVMAIIERRRQ